MEVGREGGFHPLVSGIKAFWTKSRPFFQGVARLPSSLSPAEGRPHTQKAETGTLKWEGVTELHWPLPVGTEPVAAAAPGLPGPFTLVPLDGPGAICRG